MGIYLNPGNSGFEEIRMEFSKVIRDVKRDDTIRDLKRDLMLGSVVYRK